MKVNYDDIHQSLILKSSKFKELKNQIFMNGVIKIPKPKIDFFAFMVKTIISQQISDKAANSIWKKFCKYLIKIKTNSLPGMKSPLCLATMKNSRKMLKTELAIVYVTTSNKKFLREKEAIREEIKQEEIRQVERNERDRIMKINELILKVLKDNFPKTSIVLWKPNGTKPS